MNDLIPPNVLERTPYKPGKPLEELERELGITGAIKLASNENPYGAAPEVLEVIQKNLGELGFYPDGAAYALRSAIADFHNVSIDEVVPGNGSNELIDLICFSYPTREDHIVFGDPSFVCYRLGALAAGVSFTAVPLTDNLSWDVDALLSAVTEKTKLLFLANPNNPTGAHMGEADLKRLITELPPRVLLVVDEAYVEFADAPDYKSAQGLDVTRERMIVLRTFSKAYGLAALRIGYALGSPEVLDGLRRMRAPFNVGRLAQAAGVIALKAQDHLERYVRENRKERSRVAAALSERGLRVAPSQTNFLLVGFEEAGAAVYERLLRQGVIVRPMPAPIEQWLRITVGTPAQNDRLIEALDVVL